MSRSSDDTRRLLNPDALDDPPHSLFCSSSLSSLLALFFSSTTAPGVFTPCRWRSRYTFSLPFPLPLSLPTNSVLANPPSSPVALPLSVCIVTLFGLDPWKTWDLLFFPCSFPLFFFFFLSHFLFGWFFYYFVDSVFIFIFPFFSLLNLLNKMGGNLSYFVSCYISSLCCLLSIGAFMIWTYTIW